MYEEEGKKKKKKGPYKTRFHETEMIQGCLSTDCVEKAFTSCQRHGNNLFCKQSSALCLVGPL